MSRPAVLITGAAQRIGREIARRFGEANWHVIVHYRSSGRAADLLAASLPSAETVQCDLTAADDLAAMMNDIAKRLPDWRCCIASAAAFEPDSAAQLDSGTFDHMVALNAKAAVQLLQMFLANSRASSGRRAIAVTDQKLANPNPDFFSYTLSKAALAAAVPLLAMGAGRRDDRVYGVAPGAILPSHDQDKNEVEISHRLNLLRRKTAAAEVADACLFLADGLLASGQTLFIDSGQHLLRQPRDVIYLAREKQVR